MGETMGELGLAFIKLTKFENEEALFNSQRVRAADMKNVATAAVKASRYYRELNAQTVKHLVSFNPLFFIMSTCKVNLVIIDIADSVYMDSKLSVALEQKSFILLMIGDTM